MSADKSSRLAQRGKPGNQAGRPVSDHLGSVSGSGRIIIYEGLSDLTSVYSKYLNTVS